MEDMFWLAAHHCSWLLTRPISSIAGIARGVESFSVANAAKWVRSVDGVNWCRGAHLKRHWLVVNRRVVDDWVGIVLGSNGINSGWASNVLHTVGESSPEIFTAVIAGKPSHCEESYYYEYCDDGNCRITYFDWIAGWWLGVRTILEGVRVIIGVVVVLSYLYL